MSCFAPLWGSSLETYDPFASALIRSFLICDRAPLLLGGNGLRARYQNLVAEPMEAPRAALCLCRTFLTVVITLALAIAGLEFLMSDDATLVDAMTTTSSQVTRTISSGDGDDSAAYSLVTTTMPIDEPNNQAATVCQLSRFKRWCTLMKRVILGRSSNWTMGAIVLLSGMMLVSASVCYMQQAPFRPHPMQHGPRSNAHQSDAGPPFIGTATLKVPPSWSVERNHVYSLRAWISDLVLWASASDLDPVRHGPVAALQVQGTAKELIRELTPQQLQHGDVDPATGQQLTGLMLLVTVLARRYAPLEAENTTKSIAEFLAFRRQPGETIDSLFVRFDTLRNRAQQRAGFAINMTGLTWLLLQSLGIGAESWDRLLAPLGGPLAPDPWGAAHAACSGVHFFGAELENLRSVSQAASVVPSSATSRKRATADDPAPATPNAPSKAAPKCSPSFFPTTHVHAEVEPLIANAPQPSSPPPTDPAPDTIRLGLRSCSSSPIGDSARAAPRATAGASEAAPAATSGIGVHNASDASDGRSVHSQAEASEARSCRMSREQQQQLQEQSVNGLQNVLLGFGIEDELGPAVGLLNASAATAVSNRHVLSLTNILMPQPPRFMPAMPMPQIPNVPGVTWPHYGCGNPSQPPQHGSAQSSSGVGKSAQVADQAACIPMAVLDVFGKKSDATYTAPIIQDSMLPPLLGNRTLRKMQMIMDCGSGKLTLPGPGGVEVKMSPGSKAGDNDDAAVTSVPPKSINMAEEIPEPMVKPAIAMSKVDNLAWVFSDKVGLRQRLLQEVNFRTVHFYHDLHSRSQCQRLLNELAHQCPLVLWIRLAGPCAGSGNKQDALRAENLVRLLAQQKASNRYLIVEASDNSSPSQMPAKGQPELNSNSKPVLAEEPNTDATGSKKAVRYGSLHAAAKFDSADASSCKSKQHANAKSFDSKRDFWISHGEHCLIRVHVEPRNSMYMPHADECPIALHDLESHRQTKLQQCISDVLQQSPPILIDDDWRSSTTTDMQFHWVGTTSFAISPKFYQQQVEQISERPLKPYTERPFEPFSEQSPKHEKHDSLRQLYSTESALRQKQKKEEGHVVRHRKKFVEQHCDDSGDNFDILQIDNRDNTEANEKELYAGEQALYDLACLVVGNPSLMQLGSDVDQPQHVRKQNSSPHSMASIFYQRAKCDEPGIACMELFGGAATTTFLPCKYRTHVRRRPPQA
eukprot:s3195_g9.t1